MPRFGVLLVIPIGIFLQINGDLPMTSRAPLGTPVPVTSGRLRDSGPRTLRFEENRGQVHRSVRFLARAPGYTLFLTDSEAVLTFPRRKSSKEEKTRWSERAEVLRMQLANSLSNRQLLGQNLLQEKHHYLRGKDAAGWIANIPTYGSVRSASVYPGIDLIYHANEARLEYDFLVAPHASPSLIKIAFEGADQLSLDADGSLRLQLDKRLLLQPKPVAYQEVHGVREQVNVSYVLKPDGQVGFEMGRYDPNRPLIIDPEILYSTFLGGNSDRQTIPYGSDMASVLAVDSHGQVVVAGIASSTDFPLRNALDPIATGDWEAFVAKLSASGQELLFSTYLGGSGSETPTGLVLDGEGNICLVGGANSSDFPILNAFQSNFAGPSNARDGDAFLLKLKPDGSGLISSTFLGGTHWDKATGVALDSVGNIYVTGETSSRDFPLMNPFDDTKDNADFSPDVFVSKFNPEASQLIYSTYLGGNDRDEDPRIAIDSQAQAFVAGKTFSRDFPIRNAYFSRSNHVNDGFITTLNPQGNSLVFSTYVGGDGVNALALDRAGSLYFTGVGRSSDDFKKITSLLSPLGSHGASLYVAKLRRDGSDLIFNTLLGGPGWLEAVPTAIAVDQTGNVFVSGRTESSDFPLLNAFDDSYGGGFACCFAFGDGFLFQLNPTGTGLIYSTYLGGAGADSLNALGLDSQGNVYVAGQTGSADFPVRNALDNTLGGWFDAFVTKVSAVTSGLSVSGIAPDHGPISGGTEVTIKGTSFSPATTATLGGIPLLAVKYINSETLTAITPPHGVATVDLVVSNAASQTWKLPLAFSFLSAPPQPVVKLSLNMSSTREVAYPLGKEVSFTVSRTRPWTGALTVSVGYGGTTTVGQDYQSPPTTVVIPAGSESAVGWVRLTDDFVTEETESFVVNVQPSSAYQVGSEGSATLSIQDDDFGILRVVPLSISRGSGPAAIDVFGSSFQAQSYLPVPPAIRWNGLNLMTTLVDETHLRAVVPAVLTDQAGVAAVSAVNTRTWSSSCPGSVSTLCPHFETVESNKLPVTVIGEYQIVPNSGAAEGRTHTRVFGPGFKAETPILVGGAPLTGVVEVSPNEISGFTAPHAAGSTDVEMTQPDGTRKVLAGAYTYKNLAKLELPTTPGLTVLRIPLASDTHRFRTNLGINNLESQPAEVNLALVDNHGNVLGKNTVTVPARGLHQMNNVARSLEVAGNLTGREASVVVTSTARIFAWASEIDNVTQDPGIQLSPLVSSSRILIPSTVSNNRFRTALTVVNGSASDGKVNLTLRNVEGQIQASLQELAISAHGFLQLEDLYRTLGVDDSYGPLEIEATGIQLSAMARISSLGTHGYFEGVDPASASTLAFLPSDWNSVDLRTNIGINNPGALPANVVIRLFRQDGNPLPFQRGLTVPPRGMVQLNEFSPYLLRFPYTGVDYLRLESDQPMLAWSSVIDNVSQDPGLSVGRSIGASRLLLPSVTNVGSFRSSLTVVNTESTPTDVEISFRNVDGTVSSSITRTIASSGMLDLPDVLQSLNLVEAYGPLEIRSLNQARLLAVSRVASDQRTAGFFDAVPFP